MEYRIQELKQIIAIQQDVIYDLSEKLAKERIGRLKELERRETNSTITIPVKYVRETEALLIYDPPING